MRSLASPEKPRTELLSGHGILKLAVLVSLPVIGLDQFLRVSPAQFAAQPGTEIQHWVADSLMATPLFAVGILAGDWIAGRARLRGGSPRGCPQAGAAHHLGHRRWC